MIETVLYGSERQRGRPRRNLGEEILVTEVAELKKRWNRWKAALDAVAQQRQRQEETIQQERELLNQLKEAVNIMQFVAQQVNQDNEQRTAVLATHALQETFKGQNLSLKLSHETYRGQPGVELLLRDEDHAGVEGEPMDSFGGGPCSLLGIILQAISIVKQPGMARVLILDEPMAQISEGYQEAAGELLKKLCDDPPRGLGFKMLVVTHLPLIAAAAHRRYHVETVDGALKLTHTTEGEE
jgi:ABC-type Mn2+/Zn2+ transport system ATPase subunit